MEGSVLIEVAYVQLDGLEYSVVKVQFSNLTLTQYIDNIL